MFFFLFPPQEILCNINKSLCDRLDRIEKKLESVDQRIRYLEDKVVPFIGVSGNTDAAALGNSKARYSRSHISKSLIVVIHQLKKFELWIWFYSDFVFVIEIWCGKPQTLRMLKYYRCFNPCATAIFITETSVLWGGGRVKGNRVKGRFVDFDFCC